MQRFQSLLLALASTLFALMLGELGARALDLDRHVFHQGHWPGFRDQIGYFIPDQELGYRPNPEMLRLGGGRFGYQNGEEHDLGEPAIDIGILGDSIAQYNDAPEVFAKFSHRFPLAVRAWNIGVGGYNAIQESLYLETHLERLPDHLVLFYCLNDNMPSMTISAGDQPDFESHFFEPLNLPFPRLFRVSALYRAAAGGWIAITGSRPHPHDMRIAEAGIRRMRDYLAEHEVSFTVVVFPFMLADPEAEHRKRYDASVRNIESLGVDTVGLWDAYYGYGLDRLERSPGDFVHPNREGIELAIKELLDRFGEKLTGKNRGAA